MSMLQEAGLEEATRKPKNSHDIAPAAGVSRYLAVANGMGSKSDVMIAASTAAERMTLAARKSTTVDDVGKLKRPQSSSRPVKTNASDVSTRSQQITDERPSVAMTITHGRSGVRLGRLRDALQFADEPSDTSTSKAHLDANSDHPNAEHSRDVDKVRGPALSAAGIPARWGLGRPLSARRQKALSKR